MWFFKPSWQSKNKEKALKAVSKETVQLKLAEVYKNAPLLAVRDAALQRLTDQDVLVELAKNSAHNDTALLKIIQKLTDQTTLADIAENSAISHIRAAALDKLLKIIQKITDQTTLADIAENSAISYIRVAALDKLTDQTLARVIFTDIIRKSKKSRNEGIRIDAVRILTNQSFLADLAKNDIDIRVREAAVEKLTNQEVLTQIAKYDHITHLRIAAAKKLADRGLAEEIVNNIELARKRDIESANKIGTATAKQPLSYDEFVNSVKSFMNIKECHKVEEAIEKLTNQNVLSEIIKDNALDWCFDRGVDNYGPYNIIDLRDTARNRLEKLKKSNPAASTQVQPESLGKDRTYVVENALPDYAPGQKPNNDLFFIVEALKKAPTIPIEGFINGLVIMTPSFTKTIQKFPSDAERMYQIRLNSLPGPQILDFIRDPALPVATTYYGTVNIFTGFPQRCLKCRKSVKNFELLMFPVDNPEKIPGRVNISGDNAREIFDVLLNVRNFIAVPCCAEHSLARRFFFWKGMNPFFTDDEDIAKTCMVYSTLTQPANPVKVVNGKIID